MRYPAFWPDARFCAKRPPAIAPCACTLAGVLCHAFHHLEHRFIVTSRVAPHLLVCSGCHHYLLPRRFITSWALSRFCAPSLQPSMPATHCLHAGDIFARLLPAALKLLAQPPLLACLFTYRIPPPFAAPHRTRHRAARAAARAAHTGPWTRTHLRSERSALLLSNRGQAGGEYTPTGSGRAMVFMPGLPIVASHNAYHEHPASCSHCGRLGCSCAPYFGRTPLA